ncbi:MAG TPA: Xaa-Pro peptidase family protein [Candidatus Wallbacteria bacterium]|nr:MAG: Xaa-Pro dipeptidase [bacterium ADurb.Bin243]HOD39594.1 Xaa-Pro peptidase family protein [Candidatus Wallbacteria bacterium]HPG58073.1 Xaa-Pro peptidase family protein [Candidatus Wallbacteria bacterium]
MKVNQLRVGELQNSLRAEKMDAFLISKMENIRYLSGFSGSTGYMLVDGKSAYIFVDFRYVQQVKKETSGIEIIQTSRSQAGEVCEFIKKKKYKKIGVEGGHLSVNNFGVFEGLIAKTQKLIATGGFIEKARMVKSKDEIALIKKAVELADVTFYEMVSKGRENFINKSESEVAAKLEYYMKCGGAQSPSFESIVAFGPNSAYPHYKPSADVIVKPKSKKAGDGTFLKLDFGAKLNGYCSDMTRTIFIGKPSQKHIDVYKIVLEAQLTALSKARPGMRGSEIDKLARDVIAKYGYKDNFGHGLGHGVGLEIHEGPTVSSLGEVVVAENMVFTVEPGVYIPGFGGVRIEDIVVMGKTGCKILTKSPKEILIIE